MKYECPVCAYPDMQNPPKNYNICPSCGTEFGYDDFALSHRELRNQWLAAGHPWFHPDILPPPNWDPIRRLLERGFLWQPIFVRSSFANAGNQAEQTRNIEVQNRAETVNVA